MRRLSLTTILCCFFVVMLFAQEKWDVRKCVEYAVANAISVKQADIQRRLADVSLEQNKLSRWPNANLSGNAGYQFGRSVNPTTNLYTTQQLLFQGFQFNTDVTIFNWNRIQNNILSASYEADASHADVDRAKNDIALTVAASYLQALLAKVQTDIAAVQLEQTKNQLADTRKRVDAGSLPELNALDLEAQASRDSANLISAKALFDQGLLSLKANMNLDMATPFDIVVPSVESIPLENIAELLPETVYQIALSNQPAQKANQLRYQSLQYAAKAARSSLYPTFTAFGGLATNFSNPNRVISGATVSGYSPSALGNKVTIGTVDYPVLSPNISYTESNRGFGEMWNGWGNQIDQNFRQNIGLSFNVPIFNGYQARSSYERAKINIKNQEIVKEQSDQKLKQDIYTAYTSAVSALQKFNASQSSVVTAERAYDIASKRYAVGLLSTLELITSQNNLSRTRIDLANAQFDYVFKMKVLEYYKGQGIKL